MDEIFSFFVRVKQMILTKLFCTKKQIINKKNRQNYFDKILEIINLRNKAPVLLYDLYKISRLKHYLLDKMYGYQHEFLKMEKNGKIT